MKVGIDFGPTQTANWNNITANAQTIAAGSVINLAGTVVDAVSITTENGAFVNNDGTNNWVGLATNGGSAPPEFVDSVITDIAGRTGAALPYRITISGLNPALNLRVNAVATAISNPTDTFTLTGAATYGPSSLSRPTAQSQGLFHTFNNVKASAGGTLVIDVTDPTNNNPIVNGILITVIAPIAVADAVTMNYGGQWRAGVLANDTVNAPLASVQITQAPSFGTAVVQADGTVLYHHTTGTPATDGFRYRFTDAIGLSNEGQVTISFTTGRVSPVSLTLPLTPPATSYYVEDAFLNRGALTFGTPTWMSSIPGNANRFFVSERTGVIWEIPNIAATPATRRVFMTLAGRLDLYTEMGVKSFVFHPQFQSGKPYVYVTYNLSAEYPNPDSSATVGSVRLSRFTATGAGLDTVDLASEQILFEVDSRSQDHNIDSCRFGPDGYLYLGSGDERRPAENAQTITNMFWSSVIRIDVDRLPGNFEPNASVNGSLVIPKTGGVANYKVPADNPYAASSGTVSYNSASFAWNQVRSEIYITGVRNPWQFSFDTIDGAPVLWLGDIGSDGTASREEVNIFRKGDNGGWDHIEGDRLNRTIPLGTTVRAPEWFYARGSGTFQGASVIGGLMLSGAIYPEGLGGKYIFGDWLNGQVWALKQGATPGSPTVERVTGVSGPVGFARDPSNGDILILSWNSVSGGLFDNTGQVGKLFRLKTQTVGVGGTAFPQTLSATGAFADLTTLAPNPGIHYYEPNVTFWSDYAKKTRWFALPAGSSLTYHAEGVFDSPAGAVWVKHFDLETVRGNPATKRRIETRFLIKRTDGGVYGISYAWNQDGTEATLVPDAGSGFDLSITDPSLPAGQQAVTQHYQIPSRTQCITCHNPTAGQVLGFDSRQLNRSDVPLAGQNGNYLQLLASAGYLQGLTVDPATVPRHYRAEETAQPLKSRVRSYLAVNCAYCHADANGMDLRASADMTSTRLFNTPETGQIAVTDPLLRHILPGAPQHSSVLQRVAGAIGFNRMPPLGSSEIDKASVTLLTDWINQLVPTITSVGPFAVNENLPAGSVVTGMTATDPENTALTWAIASNSPLFAIDPVTGQLSLTGPPDYETTPGYSISVSVSDAIGGVTSSAIQVNLNNLIDTNGERVTAALSAPGSPFAGVTDPNVIGFAADPDHDGVANAFEVLIGSDPSKFTKLPMTVSQVIDAGGLHVSVDVDVDAAAADTMPFFVVYSTDLQSWPPVSAPPVVVSSSNGRRTLRFTLPTLPADSPRAFVRLRMDR